MKSFTCNIILCCFLVSIILAEENGNLQKLSKIPDTEKEISVRVEKNVHELKTLFDEYRKIAEDTDRAIKGFEQLGLHYNRLVSYLGATRNLIQELRDSYIKVEQELRASYIKVEQELSASNRKLEEENARLIRITQIPSDQLDAFIEYQNTKTKWSRRTEGVVVNLVAATIVGFVSGILCRRLFRFLRRFRTSTTRGIAGSGGN